MTRQEDYIEPTSRPASAMPARSGSSAGWWVAGLVAIVAIVGLVFIFSGNRTSEDQLQAARDTGRAEAMMDNAAASAQQMAANAQQSTAEAAGGVADATRDAGQSVSQAAENTGDAAQAAAANVGDAAQNASDRVSDPNAN